MPTASPPKESRAKYTKSNPGKRHVWRLYVPIISVVLVVVCVVTFLLAGGPKISEKGRFENYLENKYGQTFVVENVREVGVTLGGKGAWEADAYPKSDPSMEFRIDRSQTTGKIDVDTFLEVLWSKQGSSDVEEFLSKELPSNEGFHLDITPGNPGNILYDSIHGQTPSFETILAQRASALSYSLSVYDVAKLSSNEPSDTQLENAWKVVSFVKDKGIPISYVRYGYRDPSFTLKNKVEQQQYQYTIHVSREELSNITKPTDLRKYFEAIDN